ncbi:amidase [Burkholderia pseudomallei]|uniref:amidase n=1 Tax=Burkholderia pseudomallei TaxID=28450 RepID=UPI0009C7CB68|nr:amidase [Burkholderia pseudomallei]ONC98662.1 amidase [Burkholderia pseudomallei]OND06346.1 amidase [Burkholderia pseudomallei]OND09977.1 amidase [Burkholderia pseudomallei]OND12799.1 amidase [Burkholderia pseudomallei]OND18157.1 amidase [Burkholderia pseudomallei]
MVRAAHGLGCPPPAVQVAAARALSLIAWFIMVLMPLMPLMPRVRKADRIGTWA